MKYILLFLLSFYSTYKRKSHGPLLAHSGHWPAQRPFSTRSRPRYEVGQSQDESGRLASMVGKQRNLCFNFSISMTGIAMFIKVKGDINDTI